MYGCILNTQNYGSWNDQQDALLTSRLYKTCAGEGPKNMDSSLGDNDCSPSLAWSAHSVRSLSTVLESGGMSRRRLRAMSRSLELFSWLPRSAN